MTANRIIYAGIKIEKLMFPNFDKFKLENPPPSGITSDNTCINTPVIRSLPPIYELFKDWCKETNRNGGVIIGSSIRDFCTWCDLKLKEASGGNAV